MYGSKPYRNLTLEVKIVDLASDSLITFSTFLHSKTEGYLVPGVRVSSTLSSYYALQRKQVYLQRPALFLGEGNRIHKVGRGSWGWHRMQDAGSEIRWPLAHEALVIELESLILE